MTKNSSAPQKEPYPSLYSYSQQFTPSRFLEKVGIKNVTKKSFTKFLFAFLFCLVACTVSLFVSFLLQDYPDKSPIYMYYLLLVVLTTAISGTPAGLLITVVLALEALFFFRGDALIFQEIFFIVSSFLIILIIDRIGSNAEINSLRKKQKVYAESFVALSDKYNKAKHNIKARDEFLSVVSHELRTPLTTMLVTLHNMLNTIRNVSMARFSIQELINVLKNSEIQIKRLTIIINDLLDVSLITTGRMELVRKKTDLVTMTRRVVDTLSGVLTNTNHKSRILIEANDPVVGNFDQVRIEQAITNLVSNAIKYGGKKPIFIKIVKKNTTAYFMIQDQGIGIPPEDQTIIFDLFKRTKWSEEHSNGLGVGLYITNQIVKAHGGRLTIASKPSKGSTFTITLPLE